MNEITESNSQSDLNGQNETYWSRPCGGRDVVRIALPLMISTFSYSVMQFCDRIFLTWWSPTSVAASLPASVMAWTLLAFPLGVAMYTNVFVAQYFGAGQHARIGRAVWHGMILGGFFVPIFVAAMIWPDVVFRLSGHNSELSWQESEYLRYIAPGSIAHVFAGVVAGFFIGRGRTTVVMFVDVLAASANVAMDWLLIFGFAIGPEFVIPAMGIRGAAIATSLAIWFKLIMLVALLVRRDNRRSCALFGPFRFEWNLLSRMLRFGSANGWQMFIECLGIAVFSLMIGGLGEVPAAASSLAISVNMLVFVPIWGLSMGVSTLVGQQIGRARPDLAERATWTALHIGLVYSLAFAVLYLSAPGWFLIGFDAAGVHLREVSQLVRRLLIFVALYCLFDAVQVVFLGAIKGAGDVRFVVMTSLVSSGLFVAVGAGGKLFLTDEISQLYWWWAALTGWLLMLMIAYTARFLQGKWKSMQVVEENLIATVAAGASSE